MSQTQKTQTSASQIFTLPDEKIIVSPTLLREILQLLSLTTPLFSSPKPPERQWSAIK